MSRRGFSGYCGIETGDLVIVTEKGAQSMAENRRIAAGTKLKVTGLMDEGGFDFGDRWYVSTLSDEAAGWVYDEEIKVVQKAKLWQRLRNRRKNETVIDWDTLAHFTIVDPTNRQTDIRANFGTISTLGISKADGSYLTIWALPDGNICIRSTFKDMQVTGHSAIFSKDQDLGRYREIVLSSKET
ncbi:MAG: hypothetical protein Q7T57_05650 [Dehalococcoidales bacterium]|nr:hypothetical protein [Dehalococcoidales bacterium]